MKKIQIISTELGRKLIENKEPGKFVFRDNGAVLPWVSLINRANGKSTFQYHRSSQAANLTVNRFREKTILKKGTEE